jgi:acyl-CoA dehydrogenase
MTNDRAPNNEAQDKEAQQLLLATADKLFHKHSDKQTLEETASGHFPVVLKDGLAEHGFHRLAERDSGFNLQDAFAVLRVAGYHALPFPLAEWMLANRYLNNPGDDFATIGKLQERCIADAPWGREVDHCLAVTADGHVYKASTPEWRHVYNIAGEASDTATIDGQKAIDTNDNLFLLLALSRCALAVGAMTRLLELVIEQVTVREQFGRPLARFQVIQHDIAAMAGEVAAAGKALEGATTQLASEREEDEIAVACARVFEATRTTSEMAHQLFGAMGFTQEHTLHHFTRRLWAWREDYGNERYWQGVLGSNICARGPQNLWRFIATDR